jgi:hypothetical protein
MERPPSLCWPPLPTDPYPAPPSDPYPYEEPPHKIDWEAHLSCPFCEDGIGYAEPVSIVISDDDEETEKEEQRHEEPTTTNKLLDLWRKSPSLCEMRNKKLQKRRKKRNFWY